MKVRDLGKKYVTLYLQQNRATKQRISVGYLPLVDLKSPKFVLVGYNVPSYGLSASMHLVCVIGLHSDVSKILDGKYKIEGGYECPLS